MNYLKIIMALLNNPEGKAILVALLKNNAEQIVDLAYMWVAAQNKETPKS